MKINFSKSKVIAATAAILILLAGAVYLSSVGEVGADGKEDAHRDAVAHADGEHHGETAAEKHGHANQHADGEHHQKAEVASKGPHGGRMFSQDRLALEVNMAEAAGEARFQAWLFKDGKPLAPEGAKLTLQLARPDGEVENIGFIAQNGSLSSNAAIAEPHVFDARFQLQLGEQSLQAGFSQEEGKIELNQAQVEASGVKLGSAGPARVKTAITLPGEIRFNEDKTAHVVPRLAGVVEQVAVNLGQQVKQGQLLAVVASTGLAEQRSELLAAQKRFTFARTTYEREKKLWEEKISAEQDYQQARQVMNEAEIALQNARQKLNVLGTGTGNGGALNRYEVRAPFSGLITEKHIALGEAVAADASIFTISDLSTVWAEIIVPAKDLNLVRLGEKVQINATAFESRASGSISYVGALLGEQTRTAKARVTLANPDMAWRPGLFVNVDVVASDVEVAVAVPPQAIQTLEDKQVVFVRIADGFMVQPVSTGRADSKQVEIVKGLKAGARYAAEGSFVLKSELGKSSAEHAH
ncbi:efflux RND transporter periplasmic adaptor subunit [Collimonas pratensis]|uniref:Cobalt-zinc-cadmium resistance protein CzcB n=1 Tax=Collimonas pratensis TaxID=279113 RepID=A0A127Q707_9BURK|nr:efflux RND transporter periplasmic adaptor subunit [Collimonas pratensis]AMP05605.1 cobalt-zinc-cadmium resistance protein CzcB [Collimonas pratensis]